MGPVEFLTEYAMYFAMYFAIILWINCLCFVWILIYFT